MSAGNAFSSKLKGTAKMLKKRNPLLFLLFSCLVVFANGLKVQAANIDVEIDLNLVSTIDGNLTVVGSDTLAPLMTIWATLFKHQHPEVNVQIQTLGSSSAVPALIESTAQLGAMSRQMRLSEMTAFKERYGYQARAIKVAIDAMAIFVHQDNPLTEINLSQIDRIFSRTLRCQAHLPISTWGQLGLKGSWQGRNISLYGRNSVSGTYGYFKELALCGGDFLPSVNELPSAASVVQSVSTQLGALGYAGISAKSSRVKVLAVSVNGKAIYPDRANIVSHAYPFSRYLYLYVNKVPNKALPTLEAEFLRLILSPSGQDVVAQKGFVPLSDAERKAQLALLNL